MSSSSRCTCCHVCHTSLKTSRRSFFPCSQCPSIICRQCIELTGQEWDRVNSLKDWSCPRCCGDCPCKRCRNKVVNKSSSFSGERKQKRKRSTTTIFEDNAFSPRKIQKTKIDSSPKSEATSISMMSQVFDKDQRIIELFNKNKQCMDYITRTERLLTLIRSEQGRIQLELESIASSEKCSTESLLSVAETLYLEETSDSDDGDNATSDSDDCDSIDNEFSDCRNSMVSPFSSSERKSILEHC